jgi:hypothetical protein
MLNNPDPGYLLHNKSPCYLLLRVPASFCKQ